MEWEHWLLSALSILLLVVFFFTCKLKAQYQIEWFKNQTLQESLERLKQRHTNSRAKCAELEIKLADAMEEVMKASPPVGYVGSGVNGNGGPYDNKPEPGNSV